MVTWEDEAKFKACLGDTLGSRLAWATWNNMSQFFSSEVAVLGVNAAQQQSICLTFTLSWVQPQDHKHTYINVQGEMERQEEGRREKGTQGLQSQGQD